ncbi:MAG: ribosome maturation factor RimM [Bryobacteraceae bacterium]|nr:ribosome maturation factor RimM [Bryobacteraceae bacterium]
MPDRVTVAGLKRPRGIRGEIVGVPLTMHPERLEELRDIVLQPSGRALTVEEVWWHGDKPIFKFAGIDSMTDAEPLAGQQVTIDHAERMPLAEGQYYFTDLVGCEVFENGDSLGVVDGYLETAGPVLLEIGRMMIPFVPEICHTVDVDKKRIDVTLPLGLRDLNG